MVFHILGDLAMNRLGGERRIFVAQVVYTCSDTVLERRCWRFEDFAVREPVFSGVEEQAPPLPAPLESAPLAQSEDALSAPPGPAGPSDPAAEEVPEPSQTRAEGGRRRAFRRKPSRRDPYVVTGS